MYAGGKASASLPPANSSTASYQAPPSQADGGWRVGKLACASALRYEVHRAPIEELKLNFGEVELLEIFFNKFSLKDKRNWHPNQVVSYFLKLCGISYEFLKLQKSAF